MENLPSQTVIATPFAKSGDKNTIGVSSDPSSMNLTDGFPAIFSTLISDGGKFLDRKDMNAILNLISSACHYLLAGGTVGYDASTCSAIGGYPLNAVLSYNDGTQAFLIQSQNVNNTVVPSGNTIDKQFTSGGVTKVWWKRISDVNVTGNAATATKLAAAKTINVQDASSAHSGTAATFDGSSNAVIKLPSTITADVIGTLTGHATSDLPLTGGTLTGTVKTSAVPCLRSTSDASGVLQLLGGSQWGNGASINLKGSNFSSNPGCIEMCAGAGTQMSNLLMTPAGAMTWAGKNVVRSVNGLNADVAGNVVVCQTVSSAPASPVAGVYYFVVG